MFGVRGAGVRGAGVRGAGVAGAETFGVGSRAEGAETVLVLLGPSVSLGTATRAL